MAGDAVLIAPVSAQFPCKQGILQGNWGFRAPGDQCKPSETTATQVVLHAIPYSK
jgi:hypothetical protein